MSLSSPLWLFVVLELPEDQRLPSGIVVYTSPLTPIRLGLRSQRDPEWTFQLTSPLTILQLSLPLVRLVLGSLLRLTGPQVAQGSSRIPVTTGFAIDK